MIRVAIAFAMGAFAHASGGWLIVCLCVVGAIAGWKVAEYEERDERERCG